MTKITPFIILYLISSVCGQLNAQTFINGSLEPGAGSSVIACTNNNALSINTMGGIHISVMGYPLAYVANSTCGLGAAADGNYFIGLHYKKSYGVGTQLLLEMSSAMKADVTYDFSFYYRGPAPIVGTGADLRYGLAADTSGVVDSVGTLTRPSDVVWTKISRSVTPKVDSKYIWVEAYSSSPSDTANITYVDNFSAYPESVPNIERNSSIRSSPNPFNNSTILELDDNVQLPCSFTIYDIAGRTIKEKQTINNRSVLIDVSDINAGIYIIQLTDKERNVYTTKLLKQ